VLRRIGCVVSEIAVAETRRVHRARGAGTEPAMHLSAHSRTGYFHKKYPVRRFAAAV